MVDTSVALRLVQGKRWHHNSRSRCVEPVLTAVECFMVRLRSVWNIIPAPGSTRWRRPSGETRTTAPEAESQMVQAPSIQCGVCGSGQSGHDVLVCLDVDQHAGPVTVDVPAARPIEAAGRGRIGVGRSGAGCRGSVSDRAGMWGGAPRWFGPVLAQAPTEPCRSAAVGLRIYSRQSGRTREARTPCPEMSAAYKSLMGLVMTCRR
jgi:hypothetical protein